MALHHIAIVGATGNIGPFIIAALLEHKDHFTSITAVTHSNPDDAKFHDLKSKGVKVVHAKFDDKHSLVEAFKGVDAVVSTIGTAAAEEQVLLIDAAVEAGVKRFVPSEFGIDTSNPKISGLPVFGAKVKVAHHIEELAKQGKITHTNIIISAFADWGLNVGFLGFNLKTHEATLWDDGKHLAVFTAVKDIASFTAAALRHHEISSNKYLRFAGFVATQQQILQALEKIGGNKWTTKSVPIADVLKHAQEAFEKKDFGTWAVDSLHAAIFSGDTVYHTLDNHLFPEVRPATLDETVRAVLSHH